MPKDYFGRHLVIKEYKSKIKNQPFTKKKERYGRN